MLTDPILVTNSTLRHAFFTRHGGVSAGRYASMNCGLGSQDDPDAVARNRALAMDRLDLPAAALTTVYQVHSAQVVHIDAPLPPASRPQADALVSARPGVALGILTADCAPVLLADAGRGVIGAAHAGWRGARDGILEATLAAMTALGARTASVVAAVGPCIRQPSYEVGEEFRATFVTNDANANVWFVPAEREGHFHFDLAGYVVARLIAAGIASANVQPHDTFADVDQFFSYRRVTRAGGGDYGRMLSAIALVP